MSKSVIPYSVEISVIVSLKVGAIAPTKQEAKELVEREIKQKIISVLTTANVYFDNIRVIEND